MRGCIIFSNPKIKLIPREWIHCKNNELFNLEFEIGSFSLQNLSFDNALNIATTYVLVFLLQILLCLTNSREESAMLFCSFYIQALSFDTLWLTYLQFLSLLATSTVFSFACLAKFNLQILNPGRFSNIRRIASVYAK